MRKRFHVPTVLVAAAMLLVACTTSNDAKPAPGTTPGTTAPAVQSALPAGSPLQDPPSVESRNGVLETTLTVGATTYDVAGRQVSGVTYDGLLQPPTLKVKPGDTIRVSLVNNLPDGATNLQFHGLDVGPAGDAADVFAEVGPGQTRTYTIVLPPDHEQGLFWYHPDLGPAAEAQVLGGLSGLIQVGAPTSQLPPELDGITVRSFALKDLPLLPQVVTPPASASADGIALDGRRVVNGQVDPTVTIAPGEVQLWRFANIGADVPYLIALPGTTFYVVNTDGVPQPAMTPTTTLALPPGKRLDALVVGPAAGSVDLVTEAVPFGDATVPSSKLATVVAKGDARTPPALPLGLLNGKGPVTTPVTVQRSFVLGFDAAAQRSTINGRSFDPGRVDTTVTGGATEQWTITNSTAVGHAFHLHTDFQVVLVNGVPPASQGPQDTVEVPPGGSVVLDVRFDPRFPGRFVYQSHILRYAAGGMVGTIEVQNPAAAGTTAVGPAA